jgi:MFS family permease
MSDVLAAASGSFVAVPLMKRIGRKKTMILAYFLLCTPGSLLQLFAPNTGALVVGRFWNCKQLTDHS